MCHKHLTLLVSALITVSSLAQPGTFAGNDAIVAFARLHNVSVVIHQLNSKVWVIHPSNDHNQGNGREVHIAYHNGDHYNSVRRIGDDSETPTSIKLLTQVILIIVNLLLALKLRNEIRALFISIGTYRWKIRKKSSDSKQGSH